MTSIPAENRETSFFSEKLSRFDANDNSLAVKGHCPVNNWNVMLNNKSTKSS